jgi:hypothetical protein
MLPSKKQIITDLIEQARKFRVAPSDDGDEETAVTSGYRYLVTQLKRLAGPLLPEAAASRLDTIDVEVNNIYSAFDAKAELDALLPDIEAALELVAIPASSDETPLDKAIRFQNALIALATGGAFDGGDAAYKELRRFFANLADMKTKLPDFVRRCSDLGQFWGFIKYERAHYHERRTLIWEGFRPLIEYLEAHDRAPSVTPITEALAAFDPEHVHAAWQKALDRRLSDPEGAITAARMLLETVCKHVLDKAGKLYPGDADLPKLWSLSAEHLNLAPHQHQEKVFKAILGNCQSVVNHLASIRNMIGDAHGQGRRPVKPQSRHAELAVNLAGTMAAFLVSTWKEQVGEPYSTER